MEKIKNIDKNLKIEASIGKEDIRFFDAEEKPFKLYGIFKENGKFRRMPEKIAENVSEGVRVLHTNTAGGRVRFATDSAYVAIRTEYTPYHGSHFTLAGSSGYDLYSEDEDGIRFEGTFLPPYQVEKGYESVIDLTEKRERIITINFPPYSDVHKLYIGVQEQSVVKEAPDYHLEKPIVFYGSSITQGACASRPGMSYQNILSRRFHCDYVNLGFSGSAKGEKEMADYISSLEMSVFIMDYDHNAPTPKALKETHEPMFQKIRKENPQLPIILLSRPKFYLNEEEKERFEIIKRTYCKAKEDGDNNVYLIDGKKLMSFAEDNGTVDGCHPTDLGFFCMANAIGEILEKILKTEE